MIVNNKDELGKNLLQTKINVYAQTYVKNMKHFVHDKYAELNDVIVVNIQVLISFFTSYAVYFSVQ